MGDNNNDCIVDLKITVPDTKNWDDFKANLNKLTIKEIKINNSEIDQTTIKDFPIGNSGGSLVNKKKTKKRKLFNGKKKTRVKR
jgi:hypothetical protein